MKTPQPAASAIPPASTRLARVRSWLHDGALNFVLTNRIPRRTATRLVGWISHTRQWPVPQLSMAIWRLFSDLDLSDARSTRFASLHDCFTRELRPGARPFDSGQDIVCSPSDAILGACGRVQAGQLLQVKGQSYELADLLLDASLAAQFENGCYATLRLTASMYHRFHAPDRCVVHSVRHVPGDVWNVNPPTLERVPRLYCRNERAVLGCRLEPGGHPMALVPVAAILVAGIRLPFLAQPLRGLQARKLDCESAFERGDEMGYFEHGSTIIVLLPAGFRIADGLSTGQTLRAGQALMQWA